MNLLPVNQRHSDSPGDDKDMVRARTLFLNGGWYSPLRDAICDVVGRVLRDNPVVIDAGCGEGYYSEALCSLARERNGRLAGIDLSKDAAKRAAKRCTGAELAVATVYHMPVGDQTAELVTDCFAPLAIDEFHRVLKPGGFFLYVVPGQRHLWEMKEILYDLPYENEIRHEIYDGFHQSEEIPVDFRFRLQEREQIGALFRMTPYAWKTPKEGVERLLGYHDLDLTASFRILIFQKNGFS